jgi:YHS domain-containing protein
MQKGHFSCSSCGGEAEFSTEEPPCKALSGWLVVSHWKGLRAVDHYYFCSFTCLKRWVDAQAPEIPEAFLKAFEDESGGENTHL